MYAVVCPQVRCEFQCESVSTTLTEHVHVDGALRREVVLVARDARELPVVLALHHVVDGQRAVLDVLSHGLGQPVTVCPTKCNYGISSVEFHNC